MVKEKKIRKIFEAIYQEQLDRHRRGETIMNLCMLIRTQCALIGEPDLWFEIQEWFRPERYDITHLYREANINKPTPIEHLQLGDIQRYYWYPVLKAYNLSRLGILEREIDNQLKEEGYGEG